MLHELKIQSPWFERIRSGAKRAEVRKHDRDYQVGDLIDLVEVDSYGGRKKDFVERDSRGRFMNAWVNNPPLRVRITHVLLGTMADGLTSDYRVLSIELIPRTVAL